MSRIATLGIAFESHLAEAREAYDEFARFVEGRTLKIPVEWQPPSSGAPGSPTAPGAPSAPSALAQTFGGLQVPFPVSPFAAPVTPAATPTAAGPIQQATAPVVTRTLTDAFKTALVDATRRRREPIDELGPVARAPRFDELSPLLRAAREDAGASPTTPRRPGGTVRARVGSPAWEAEMQQDDPNVWRAWASEFGTGPEHSRAHLALQPPEAIAAARERLAKMYDAEGSPLADLFRPGAKTAIAPPRPPRRPPDVAVAELPQPEEPSEPRVRRVFSRVVEAEPLGLPGGVQQPPGAPPPTAARIPPPPPPPGGPLTAAFAGGTPPPGGAPTQNAAIGFGGAFNAPAPASAAPSNFFARGFGFVRPLAAVYLASRAIRTAVERYDENQELNRTLATGPLERQLQDADRDAEKYSTGVGGHVRTFLGRVIEGAGIQFGSQGVRGFGRSLQFDVIRDEVEEAQRTLQTQRVSDAAGREARQINARTGLVGTAGYTTELRQIEIQRNEALTENADLYAHARGGATAGIDQQRQAILDRATARRTEVYSNAREETQDLGTEVWANRLRSMGLEFGAQLSELGIQQGKSAREFAKSIQDLPQIIRGPLARAFRTAQQTQSEAIIATEARQERATATGIESSTEAESLRQSGQTLAAAFADINATFQPVLDTLDKSAPEYQRTLAAVTRARGVAEEGAVYNEQARQTVVQGGIEAAQLRLAHQPLAAALAEIQANTVAQITGVPLFQQSSFGFPTQLNPAFMQPLQVGLLQQQNVQLAADDERRNIEITQRARGRVLGDLLRDDRAGAEVDTIRGRYEQERRSLELNPNLTPDVRRDLELSNRALETGELQNFQKEYGRSFRAIQVDPLDFSPTSSRDVEDPAAVYDKIKQALIDAADGMGEAIANRMATLIADQ